MSNVFKHITEEMDRQDEKWGSQREQSDWIWLAILIEEVGEAAEAMLKQQQGQVNLEILQIAAVACQWLESFERREDV